MRDSSETPTSGTADATSSTDGAGSGAWNGAESLLADATAEACTACGSGKEGHAGWTTGGSASTRVGVRTGVVVFTLSSSERGSAGRALLGRSTRWTETAA